MKTPYRQVLALTVLVFATLGRDSWGQNQFDSVSAEESEKLLVRLQRVQDSEFSCLLLRRDNGFHLEYTNNNKVDLREGALSEAAASELQTLLSNQSLATLSQQNP